MEKMLAKLAEAQEEEDGRPGRLCHIPRALSVSTCIRTWPFNLHLSRQLFGMLTADLLMRTD